MNLSSQWRLSSDERCFILEKLSDVTDRKTNEVKQQWKIIGYYGTPQQAHKAIISHIARDSVAMETWTEFVKAFNEAVAGINIEEIK